MELLAKNGLLEKVSVPIWGLFNLTLTCKLFADRVYLSFPSPLGDYLI